MSECRQIESLLPPYVDGEASQDVRGRVEAHLQQCVDCRAAVAAQRTSRAVLRARAAQLVTPAPPDLRSRLLAASRPTAPPGLGWQGRVAAFGAAAAAVLAIVMGLELLTPRSGVLFAAQLAIDHVRCFIVEIGSIEMADRDELERRYADRYGWDVNVPPSNPDLGLTLVAARRCPFWLGDHAHVLYRHGPHEVSLYVTPGADRPREHLSVLGHVERIWSVNGRAYALVARGIPDDDLARIASYLEVATR